MNTLEKFEKRHLKELQSDNKLPKFSSGDTIKVHLKVKEGEKERIQVFEGVCISKKSAGLNSSFTVRKISYGEGIERILPLFSPQINKIEVVKVGSVRRSKLYYLRKRSGKSARIAEKIKKKIGIDIAPEPKQAIENVVSDDKIKKETSTEEKKTEVLKVKKQTSDKKLEAENKPKK